MLRSAIHVTAFWLAVAAAVGAQEVPVDAHLQGFEPLGEYRLVVAGKADPAAAMYRSQRGGSAMLVEAPSLPGPVLLSPRARSVERVPAEKIVRNQDGSLDLLADAELAAAGSFEIDDGTVSFALDGREVRLEEEPYLLGLHGTEAMLERDPGYAFHAAKYSASPPILRGLKSVAEPVRVRVFFGSWCPSCKQMLPRILRVAEELAGTPI
ncbi:MAG TPA: thioredoxin family protein, partial [Thermoanaerobaculia bacterium]|nr:thioredoxin family protein [Thermoanaerobaculia bacterium]